MVERQGELLIYLEERQQETDQPSSNTLYEYLNELVFDVDWSYKKYVRQEETDG